MTMRLAGAALAAVMACAAMGVTAEQAEASTFQVGDPTQGENCIPFGGCAYITSHDQQLYSNNLFDRTIKIEGLDFYLTRGTASAVSNGYFTIYLATTNKFPLTLNRNNLDENLGPDRKLVYWGVLPSLIGNVLALNLSQDFIYNPLAGNLILDVQVSGEASDQFDTAGFASSRDKGLTRLLDNKFTGSADVDYGYGLATGFEVVDGVSSVPLPASAPLFGAALLGLAGLGYGMKRRSRSPEA